ncbi:hypothetical protein N431DRAFT_542333 [Stipitochalara longipes BDJ]|nr:hypothetical protein N431DRAFT_542333 [Stipitochalara longipes BDJ]
MFVKSTVAVTLLASFVAAQTNLTFDPSTIDLTTRGQWCQAEFNTCKALCGTTSSNNCDPNTLNFTCSCASNNSAPGLQFYQQTMPTFVCEQNFKLCNAAAVNDVNSAAAQAACAATEQADCGHIDPANFTAVSSVSTASATASPTGTAAGNTATTSSSKGGAATMAAMRNIGTGAFAVGAGVVFGALL